MMDSPSYRIDNDHVEPEFSTLRRTIPEFISDGVLVIDTTKQAIVDAWNETEDWNRDGIRTHSPEVAAAVKAAAIRDSSQRRQRDEASAV